MFRYRNFKNVGYNNPSTPAVYSYETTEDTVAQVSVSGYFSDPRAEIREGDLIIARCTDGSTTLTALNGDSVVAMPSAADVSRVITASNDGFDIILLCGQSNMVGVDTTGADAALDATNNMIYQFNQDDTITVAVDPLDHVGVAAGSIGLGLTLAKKYLANEASGRRVLLIPAAKSATGFVTNQWNIGDVQHERAIEQTNKAIALNPNNRVVAIMWNQGENDKDNGYQNYAENLAALVRSFRSRISGAENAPFISATIPTWSIEFSADVNNAINKLADLIDNFFVVDVTNLQTIDTVHYNARSARELGARYADKYTAEKYLFNLVREKDSVGHWIFGDWDSNFFDPKSGKSLTVFDVDPTINTNYLSLANANPNYNALVSDISDSQAQTICMVIRHTASNTPLFTGTNNPSDSPVKGAAYYVTSDTVRVKADTASPFPAAGLKTSTWQFLAISQSATNQYIFFGNSVTNVFTSVSRTTSASDNTIAIGNRFFSGFSSSFDVAEFFVIGETLNPRLLDEAYQRSVARMAALGITLD